MDDERPVPPEIALRVRRAGHEDRRAVIDLCRSALGWRSGDPSEAFFSWKHDANPFGTSPVWLAETDDGQLAGVRVFMRWQFTDGSRTFSAVRAVDTATHPDMQGRGIFTRLTRGALPDLADDGVDFVFNTPNDQSRPGYLKMGWKVVGSVPVSLRLRSPLAGHRLLGARAAANKWSEPTEVGLLASDALSDHDAVERLLRRCDPPTGLRTARTPTYLQWRYSFDALRYRALPLGDRIEDGLLVFRLRRRGTALEAAVCEVLSPRAGGDRSAVAWMLRRTGADYALRCDGAGALRAGFIRIPRLGPVLTWRPLSGDPVPAMSDLSLALGDVELF